MYFTFEWNTTENQEGFNNYTIWWSIYNSASAYDSTSGFTINDRTLMYQNNSFLINTTSNNSLDSGEEYAFKMNEYFIYFFKKTNINYRKSSFLVGKEILVVNNLLIKFYKIP